MDATQIAITAGGILAMIFMPGIPLAKAVSRKNAEVSEIVTLGFVLGLTPQLLLYAANSFLSIKITQATTLAAIGLMTVVGLVAYFSKGKTEVKNG